MATITLVPRRGDRCKNGAVIVDIKPAWDSSGYIALCLWTEDRQTAEPYQRTVDPYVTWFVRVQDEQPTVRCTSQPTQPERKYHVTTNNPFTP